MARSDQIRSNSIHGSYLPDAADFRDFDDPVFPALVCRSTFGVSHLLRLKFDLQPALGRRGKVSQHRVEGLRLELANGHEGIPARVLFLDRQGVLELENLGYRSNWPQDENRKSVLANRLTDQSPFPA